MGEYDANQQKAFWDLPVNPTLVREDYERKWAKDCGSVYFKTIGDLGREFWRLARSGASNDALCDFLDREFIYGGWKDVVERLPAQGHTMLADFRGMLVSFARADIITRDDREEP